MSGERPALSSDLVEELRRSPDPQAITSLAVHHRIGPWLIEACDAVPDLVEETGLRPLKDAVLDGATRSLLLFGELSRLLQNANERGVEVVVLKGAAIAAQLYPQPALRPYRDLDLLVRADHVARMAEALLADGYYEKPSEHTRVHHMDGHLQRIFVHPDFQFVVEVHGDHLQIGVEPVAMADVRSRARPMVFGRGTGYVLEVHDLLVYLCVHLHRHSYDGLIWFKDLDLLIRGYELDWDLVRQRAAAEGALASVAYCLDLLPRLLGTPMPAAAVRLAASEPWWSRSLQRLLWRRANILSLQPARRGRFRRAVQLEPEAGVLRGVLTLLFNGRRRTKVRVLAARVTNPHAPTSIKPK